MSQVQESLQQKRKRSCSWNIVWPLIKMSPPIPFSEKLATNYLIKIDNSWNQYLEWGKYLSLWKINPSIFSKSLTEKSITVQESQIQSLSPTISSPTNTYLYQLSIPTLPTFPWPFSPTRIIGSTPYTPLWSPDYHFCFYSPDSPQTTALISVEIHYLPQLHFNTFPKWNSFIFWDTVRSGLLELLLLYNYVPHNS